MLIKEKLVYEKTPRLEPLEKGNDVFIFGKQPYRIQLEIPRYATITEKDLDIVALLASWTTNPNDVVQEGRARFDGGKNLNIPRSFLLCDTIDYSGLQINGIGYVPMERFAGTRLYTQGKEMKPPSTTNFVDIHGYNKFKTPHVRDDTLSFITPHYLPLGSNLASRMTEKIQNHNTMHNTTFASFLVPGIELYGRYLDLAYNDDNLGFLVINIHNTQQGRFAEELVHYLTDLATTQQPTMLMKTKEMLSHFGTRLGKAFEEMHHYQKVHRQCHFSNMYYHYINKGPLVLMDWSSLVALDGTPKEQLLYRALELNTADSNMESLLHLIFRDIVCGSYVVFFSHTMMTTYLEKNDIPLLEHGRQLKSRGIQEPTNFHIILKTVDAQLPGGPLFTDEEILAYTMESIQPQRPVKRFNKSKVGRNDPCPCRSGMKFKKCHGVN